MNNNRIELDLSKLYGYKIVDAEIKAHSIAAKIGGKVLAPVASAAILPAKIGVKVGIKVI